jgi:hypothetical protein
MGLDMSRKGNEAMRVLQFLSVVRKPVAAINSKEIATAGGMTKAGNGKRQGNVWALSA